MTASEIGFHAYRASLASTSAPIEGAHGDLAIMIGLAIVAATLLAYAARLARQPLLLAYIAAGVAIGPRIGLGWVADSAPIETVARLGLAFLLFIVGLEINPRKLLAGGRKVVALTSVQVAGSFVLVFAAAWLLGQGRMAAFYLAVAGAFSSTMITVKLLSDRNELDTLPGRVTLGVLLFQDVIAIAVLALQPSFGSGGALPVGTMALAVLKGFGLLAAAATVSRFVLPVLFHWVAKVPEVLLLSAVSWCFVVCYAATLLGFSEAMGALIAGVSIGQYPYTIDLVAKIRSLRDFFVTLFFVSLGMLLELPSATQTLAAVVLTAVVLVSRAATIWPMARLLGYGNRVGILSTIHLAQTGEFGLVAVLLGAAKYGHIQSETVTLVIILLLVTSTLSTYLFQFSHPLARAAMRLLGLGGAGKSEGLAGADDVESDEPAVMLVGCFRTGSLLVHELRSRSLPVSVIDFNPHLRSQLEGLGVPFVYGDISHLDTLEHSGVDRARALVVPISDDFLRGTDNVRLIRSLRRLNKEAKIIVTATSLDQARTLYDLGADYVVLPDALASDAMADVLSEAVNGQLDGRRAEHMARLDGQQALKL
jgi:Kef-type K+ transport system membrane component KefB/voltage-gated potassium channel Kch